MRVFIAEKPSQGRDIAAVLGCNKKREGYLEGNDCIVTWAYGHLLSLANPEKYDEKYKRWNLADLPIIPKVWKLEKNKKSKEQLKIVKECIEQADEVIIATDADREGELIARLIIGHAKYKGDLKRLWLSALDESSIKKALDNLKDGSETYDLFQAALGRSRADWIAGMSYTRACTLVYGSSKNMFSVGRVQTPTLGLIVERDLEIENFKSKDFFGITGIFRDISANWVVPESAKGDEDGRCLDEKIVKAVVDKCKGKEAKIVEADTKSKQEQSPLCLSLSELQKQANNRYGYDAKDVLEIAQKLYEKYKATTYPRSDCNYLPLSQQEDIDLILANLNNHKKYKDLVAKTDNSFTSRVWNDDKVAESSHHAIIPTTNSDVDTSSMSKEEKNVYDIIVRYYLAQFLGNYQYDESFIAIECEEEQFTTKGIVPKVLGWKEAIKPSNEDNDNQDEKTLPQVSKDEVISCDSLEILNKKTTPPKHYTDATLISAMKNCGRKIDDKKAKEMLSEVKGIGTEATRADVIETLKDREYIAKKGKSIISTDKGKEIIKQLPDELTSVMITADWEQKLTSIAKGQYSYDEFLKDITQSAIDNIGLISSQLGKVTRMVAHPCPKCGSELIRMKSKDDKKKGYYWMCDQIQEGCKTFMDDKDGKPVPKAKTKIADEKCPKCKSEIQQRKGENGKFWSCTNYPDCKSTFPNEKGKPIFMATTKKKCPKCDSKLRQMKSDKGLFWGCTNYPK